MAIFNEISLYMKWACQTSMARLEIWTDRSPRPSYAKLSDVVRPSSHSKREGARAAYNHNAKSLVRICSREERQAQSDVGRSSTDDLLYL